MDNYEELRKIKEEIIKLEERKAKIEHELSGYYLGYIQEEYLGDDGPSLCDYYILLSSYCTAEEAKKYIEEAYNLDDAIEYDVYKVDNQSYTMLCYLSLLYKAAEQVKRIPDICKESVGAKDFLKKINNERQKIVDKLCETLPNDIEFIKWHSLPKFM